MKYKVILTLLISINNLFTLAAGNPPDPAFMGSSFSYQGELLDNGSPANDEYDIIFDAYNYVSENGTPIVGTDSFFNIQVSNGLFEVPIVDFGNIYNDFEIWIEISIRKSSIGGTYTALDTRQRLGAVPNAVFAQNLAANGANIDDVLKFNGVEWVAAAVGVGATQWISSGNEIYYSDGNVGIGTSHPLSPLHVNSGTTIPARFNGTTGMFLLLTENGSPRGYLGSFQSAGGNLNDEDFEIGTNGGNTVGNFHLVTQAIPRVTVDPAGLVGVGTTNPLAKLHVNTVAGEDSLRVQVNNQTKLWVKEDGTSNFFGDTKQSQTQEGMLKYMVYLNCNDGGSAVTRFYNGTTTAGSITVAAGGSNGRCIIDFPSNINNRYWLASAVSSFGNFGVTCNPTATDKLTCTRFMSSTGTGAGGNISVLVY